MSLYIAALGIDLTLLQRAIHLRETEIPLERGLQQEGFFASGVHFKDTLLERCLFWGGG